MATPSTCLVTIHGIGFQQPPSDGVAGYADGLHKRLAEQLPELSDDPLKQPWQAGSSVPIYVHSRILAPGGTREQALSRLGHWTDHARSSIDVSGAPIVAAGASVAHVALVYTELEDLGPQPEATAETFFKGLAEHGHYNSILGTLRTVLIDTVTALTTHPHVAAPPTATALRPRTDAPEHILSHLSRLWRRHEDPDELPGFIGTMRQIEDDICCYVSRNDVRERIRSFVRDALLRLAMRDDVGALVLNTHSNGTVMGFDAVREMPTGAAAKIRTFITAGCPLRKYAELFTWGREVGNIRECQRWDNYFDPRDPVADPLAHPVGWRDGQPFDADHLKPFVSWPPNATKPKPFPISDLQVDNVLHSSGGGLQAHNYWANTTEFIPALAAALRTT